MTVDQLLTTIGPRNGSRELVFSASEYAEPVQLGVVYLDPEGRLRLMPVEPPICEKTP